MMISDIVKLIRLPAKNDVRRKSARTKCASAPLLRADFCLAHLPIGKRIIMRWVTGAILFGLVGLVTVTVAQEAEPPRRFWPPSFRPPAATPEAKPKPANYRRTTPALPKTTIATASGAAVLGVTIWRLRPATTTDEARILLTKSGKKSEFMPERVAASTAFSEGQMVRLSIEVPRTGYLYVINREQYADNTMSEPYLIFPLNPHSSAHKVTAGRVVELPLQTDEQAVFKLHSFRPDGKAPQVAEVLTFLITPTPLIRLPRATGDDMPIKLPVALMEDWEKQWSAPVEQLELENGAGQAYTRAEQRAGNARQRLTQADALPQTVFRVSAKPGNPFAVKMPLKIGK